MSAKHSTRWFWSDWSGDPAVRRLTPAERGMWIDLLSIAAVAQPTGYVCDERGNPLSYEEIARFANTTPTDAESLIVGILAKGVASRDRTGRIWNRRMVRDVALSEKRRRSGADGAAATKLKWQQLNGLPQQLPGHVPRQTGTRAYSNKEITSTFTGAAREDAVQKTAADSNAATPAGLAKEAREAVQKAASSIGSGELSEIIQKRGWVKPC
jgi:hypothetical protein